MTLASANIKEEHRKQYIENNNFGETYQKIWGLGVNKDTRTAEQIVEDTAKDFGVTIIRGGKS